MPFFGINQGFLPGKNSTTYDGFAHLAIGRPVYFFGVLPEVVDWLTIRCLYLALRLAAHVLNQQATGRIGRSRAWKESSS